MELPEAIGNDLGLIAELDDAGFKALAAGVFKILAGSKDETAITGIALDEILGTVTENLIIFHLKGDASLSGGDAAELKRVYAALTAAVLEAARADLDEAAFV